MDIFRFRACFVHSYTLQANDNALKQSLKQHTYNLCTNTRDSSKLCKNLNSISINLGAVNCIPKES